MTSFIQRSSMLWLLSLSVTSLALGAGPSQPGPRNVTPEKILKDNGVEPTAAGVEGCLRRLIIDDTLRKRVSDLITQLGSDDFEEREKADVGLEEIGPRVIEALRRAQKSTDPEVSRRATDILARVDKPGVQEKQDVIAEAALRWVGQEKPAGSASLLLQVMPFFSNPALKDTAIQGLWATATPTDAGRLRRIATDGPAVMRAAVLPALERADGAKAEALIAGYLKDADAATRLAAARALLDRQPKAAVQVLVALIESEDMDLRLQAARLLQLASGFPAEGEAAEWPKLAERWKKWAATPDAERTRAVGLARFTLERYGKLLTETFKQDAVAVMNGYGRFRYESSGPANGRVAGGQLRLDGTQLEGDQRLFVTAENLLHRPALPAAFQVRAAIGGEGVNAGGWHVGVGVGKIRVLFHPDVAGGAFRIERIDTHAWLAGNDDMTFTPVAGVLHNMVLDVKQNPDGTVTLNVTVEDGTTRGRVFRRTITVDKETFGPIDRISLERSGRQGGAAFFGSLSIEQ